MDKYFKNGKVGILVSPGCGAGWSTWGHGDREFLCMDKTLVRMKLDKVDFNKVEEYIRKTKGDAYHVCMIGWDKTVVEWLDQGTNFIIEEHDGSESLRPISSIVMMTA